MRQFLRKPHLYLAATFALPLLLIADTFRSPESQVTAYFYVGAVRVYQYIGRPVLKGWIECRHDPTCSEYSIEAVRKHGFQEGIVLTYDRLNSCQPTVPYGTVDPVPPGP